MGAVFMTRNILLHTLCPHSLWLCVGPTLLLYCQFVPVVNAAASAPPVYSKCYRNTKRMKLMDFDIKFNYPRNDQKGGAPPLAPVRHIFLISVSHSVSEARDITRVIKNFLLGLFIPRQLTLTRQLNTDQEAMVDNGVCYAL